MDGLICIEQRWISCPTHAKSPERSRSGYHRVLIYRKEVVLRVTLSATYYIHSNMQILVSHSTRHLPLRCYTDTHCCSIHPGHTLRTVKDASWEAEGASTESAARTEGAGQRTYEARAAGEETEWVLLHKPARCIPGPKARSILMMIWWYFARGLDCGCIRLDNDAVMDIKKSAKAGQMVGCLNWNLESLNIQRHNLIYAPLFIRS